MTSPAPESNSILSLPDDLLMNCVARVSILYYPTLSLVSKSFRSLLASPDLYKTRSLLDRTESCPYVCLRLQSRENPSWFTLCRKPDQALTCDTSNKKKNGYVLAKVSIAHPPPLQSSSLVAVGSNIYNIGGSNPTSSSSLSKFDCMSHTWSEAPSSPVEMFTASAGVLDGKIYVVGSCEDEDSKSLKDTFEVYDTKTQVWDHVPSPYNGKRYNFKILCIDEKWHVGNTNGVDDLVVAYNPKEGKWHQVIMCDYTDSNAYCEIENVLYSVDKLFYGIEFKWYDTEVSRWRRMEGLVLPGTPTHHVRLANYGGKMAVLWEWEEEHLTYSWGGDKKKIWCAVITLERRKNRGIWGKVEWFDHVLTVPGTCALQKVLVATV
ncbi:putative F-box/kelch-repeat protein At5g38680 isoform X1 [Capsella rubella]|uniref:putative F-box/kelch-repeat protein At5g38680 isoform X1 n=1 Tax=Capsella rubella TaxID=81985 RepID=UPI000CD4A52D|nr:putative F-box/kelch-repeat protein At5g38680 isoform X1 [Capsella rubella]